MSAANPEKAGRADPEIGCANPEIGSPIDYIGIAKAS
jgi:hypothetical protein